MPKLPPALMIQGTASNSGKSLIAAAMCRILWEDGFNPRPFKAQNMALNSCVTALGEEMGRAQAVQAAACNIEPDARMNPVLLKPVSDCGSQVVLMGRAVGLMRVKEYMEYKATAWKTVKAAYASLAEEAGVMVLEGAGSPAEINLKKCDIVNMAMAKHAGARVLLVADIDRGGSFASLAGTMLFLTPKERSLVAGFVLNKFRGDASLLEPAMDFTSRRTGKPFLGVIPWVGDHGLPEEDSVSFKAIASRGEPSGGLDTELVDVAVIDLPHISNFTDLDPLRREPGMELRLVRRVDELGRPDAIILPGSKNSAGDLAALRKNGLAEAITALGRDPDGPMLIGICGGLQMLGQSISDPLGLEGGGDVAALGLLPLHTELKNNKTLTLVRARHVASGLVAAGYEIHHGVTVLESGAGQIKTTVCFEGEDGQPLGFGLADGAKLSRVWGTYVHGVFDGDNFRSFVVGQMRARKGLNPIVPGSSWSLDAAIGRLASIVRNSVDVSLIYSDLKLR